MNRFFLVIQKQTTQTVYSRTNDSNEPVLVSDSKAYDFFFLYAFLWFGFVFVFYVCIVVFIDCIYASSKTF